MAYIGVDKERYDAGNRFLSQDRYLANYNPRDPITFNVSPNINTGIFSPGINPFPIIPQGDGGDGINPFGGIDKGEITSDVGFGNLNDQTGMGYTLTEEDKEAIASQKNKNRLTQAAQLGLFALNPVSYLMGKGIKEGYNKFFGGNDGSSDGDGGGKSPKGTNVPSYTYEGSDEQDKDNENTGPTGVDAGTADVQDYADIYAVGGRVGFGNGGLSEYEIFKLGELGYNTKGGTVLEPFGGIKVLRDILKVNKYAYGGRVGYKDGYSVQDDMTDYATNVGKEASPGGGFEDSGGDGNNPPPPSYSTNEPPSNLTFNLVEDIDPAFSYSNRFGTLGGILNTTRTIQEEEPIGSLGYYDPSGNFGIGFDTDKGMVGAANLGNLNLGYTGVGGPTLDYMGGFANDAGRFGVNYNRDTGLNLGVSYNKKFNSGGIVGLYR